MEATAIYEVDEQFESTGEVPGFHITDDSAAEWAIKKIADRRAELARQEMAIKTMISYYEHKMVKLREKGEHETSNLVGLLELYSGTVSMKSTKTQATYKLPSGTLKRKFGGPEFVKDDDVLLEWVKANKPERVKTKESVDWAGLKAEVVVSGMHIVDENGEAIPGVSVLQKPDVFIVEA